MKLLIDEDPVTKTKERLHIDGGGENFRLETKQNVEPVTDVAKEMRKDSDGRFNLDGQTHVASIPLVVWRELEKEGIAHDDEALKEWLNQRENRAFRTHPGRL